MHDAPADHDVILTDFRWGSIDLNHCLHFPGVLRGYDNRQAGFGGMVDVGQEEKTWGLLAFA